MAVKYSKERKIENNKQKIIKTAAVDECVA